jgi:hypothetical protein
VERVRVSSISAAESKAAPPNRNQSGIA